MADRISTTPSGIGEALLLQSVEHRFADWNRVVLTVNPFAAWQTFSHLEYGNFSTPGDAPVLLGLGQSPIPAGTPEADEIYLRAATVASQEGYVWDDLSPAEKLQRLGAEGKAIATESGIPMVSYTAEQLAANPALADPFRPGEAPTTAFGVLKGASRWLFLTLDMIPEGIDALGRAIAAVQTDQLSMSQAIGGMFGADREAAATTGIPFFQYIRSAIEGERLNMGTGWFARGEVAQDIQAQLAQYTAETNGATNEDGTLIAPGLTDEDFAREKQRRGKVVVVGLNGMEYEARNLEEWKFLRNNAGRAKLLHDLQYSSPEQMALGQAHGTFQEDILDEGTLWNTGWYPHIDAKDGRYFSHSTGRAFASLITEPNTVPFHLISAPIDLGKQLLDLNVIGLGAKAVAKGGRMVGLAGEAGQLQRGTQTLTAMLAGADLPKTGALARDVSRGTLNIDAATNALARHADTKLNSAQNLVSTVRTQAPKVLADRRTTEVNQRIAAGIDPTKAENMVPQILTENQINDLIRKAANTEQTGSTWVEKILTDAGNDPDEVMKAINDLWEVGRRPGTDLAKGVKGVPVVSDEILSEARKRAEELDDLLRNRKASAIIDPATGNPQLTFDADLGRAQATYQDLVDEIVGPINDQATAGRAINRAMRQLDNATRQYELATTGMGLKPSWNKGPVLLHGHDGLRLADGVAPDEIENLGQGLNAIGPGLYGSADVPVIKGYALWRGGQQALDTTTGAKPNATVSQIIWKGADDPNFLDLRRPIAEQPEEVRHALVRAVDGFSDEIDEFASQLPDIERELFEQWLDHQLDPMLYRLTEGNVNDIMTDLEAIYDEIFHMPGVVPGLDDLNIRIHEAMNIALRDLGYDALVYQGGRRLSGQLHDAYVWIRSENLITKQLPPKRQKQMLADHNLLNEQRLAAHSRMAKVLHENAEITGNLGKPYVFHRAAGAIRKEAFDDYIWRAGEFIDDVRAYGIKYGKGKPGEVTGSAKARLSALTDNLFNERWSQVRWAQKALGDTPQALDDVQNLIRVLKRNTKAEHLIDSVRKYKPQLDPDRLATLLTGGGAMTDVVESIKAAKTHRAVRAVLGPTAEFGQGIPAAFFDAAAKATTDAEVLELFMKLNTGTRIVPQRIGLLGRYAKTGALATYTGAGAGGVVGGLEGAVEGEGFSDVIGGVITGALLGGLGGSGVSSVAAAMTGNVTRKVENIADAMDLLLAGSRSATTDIIRKAGVDMGRAQAGLGIPQQLGYAFGHSAFGRRLARHAPNSTSLNDPDHLYHTLTEYARNLGITMDETGVVVRKGSGSEAVYDTIVRSSFDTEEAFIKAVQDMGSEGYEIYKGIDMDSAFSLVANLVPNNTAAGWTALRTWFDNAGYLLGAKGVDEHTVGLLTRFAEQGMEDFVGNINAIGGSANFAQTMAIGGNVLDADKGARMIAELWDGRVNLPPPDLVSRAIGQTDALGKITQAFTGKGVWGLNGSVVNTLRKKGFTTEETRSLAKFFAPEMQRNIAIRTARAVTGTLWVPAVLLTRPLSFLSRVLGEDQFRMAAANLDNIFTHPINYFSAILANFDGFQKMGKLRGVTARSLIPDELFDDAGKLIEDGLDKMSHLDIAEDVMHKLGIYDRAAAGANKVFGAHVWTNNISRGAPNYTASVATEFRQLVKDPIMRRLAGSKAELPVVEVTDWLLNTKAGRGVMNDWLRQFDDPAQAALYARPDVLEGFVADQWARLNLKTGGDWVFVFDGDAGTKVVLNSNGQVVPPDVVKARQWDQWGNGYHVYRRGDNVLMETVRDGRIRDVNLVDDAGRKTIGDVTIGGHINDDKWSAIKDLVGDRHRLFEDRVARASGDMTGLHRFPEKVKGTRSFSELSGQGDPQGIMGAWDDMLDRIYDFVLGRPTQVFSRQPVLGQYYWERIGLTLPMMDAKTANKFRALAKAEGGSRLRQVNRIADAVEEGGVAKGILDDFDAIDLNAKAYAVERTKDTLFDLTRQRNFIDGMRVVAPFAGPMVEAFEAWGRVIKENPIHIWRRGGQLVDHLWDSSPIALQPSADERGMFWVNDKGEEMITVPFSGRIMGWLHNNINEGIPDTDLYMRARGLNVVFGPDDMREEADPQSFAGIPTAAFNPGTGPAINLAVAPLLKDREGAMAELNEWLFPFGAPDNAWTALLPYHLRLLAEGKLGEDSQRDRVKSSAEQYGLMIANGEVGMGPGYEYDISTGAGSDRAWAEARSRGTAANWVEGLARGALPTLVTPELMANAERLDEAGLAIDMLISLDALAAEARRLYSEEGNWYETPDGYFVSTEGDWEVVTAYLNDYYGTKMFSAEFLSLPTSRTLHPRSMTEPGFAWTRSREDVLAELPNSGAFLMPDYANIDNEDFYFPARDAAIDRGDVGLFSLDDMEVEIQGRLLQMRYEEIDRAALLRFGDEPSEERDVWVARAKEEARGRWERGVINEGVNRKALNELLSWDQRNWDQMNLTAGEAATVGAVLWYLHARDIALGYLGNVGVTGLGNRGQSEQEKQMAKAVVSDLHRLVAAQIRQSAENGHDLGNFVYLWERFFKPELDQNEEFDALAELARVRNLEFTP